jgi:hypothetical protein
MKLHLQSGKIIQIRRNGDVRLIDTDGEHPWIPGAVVEVMATLQQTKTCLVAFNLCGIRYPFELLEDGQIWTIGCKRFRIEDIQAIADQVRRARVRDNWAWVFFFPGAVALLMALILAILKHHHVIRNEHD